MSVSCGKWSIDSHRKPIPSQIGAPDRSVHPSRHRKTEIGVIAVAAIALYIPEPDISPAIAQRQPSVARGEYIAVLGDCVACHTAGGGRTLAGGLPFPTPVGTIYSTDITPDREYGIGDYTLKDFFRLMRLGVKPDGARLYPAMPYTAYAKTSDQDLQDLFAYAPCSRGDCATMPTIHATLTVVMFAWMRSIIVLSESKQSA
ncbi:MAG: gluconate 2-dehydrogenase cytochrome c subunit [Tardiphaga sp.]|nr:gluconate 2-dehydrogenase cytochrome c subunit [Tardiphaga sp.]